jgi:hypothetical protein
MPSKILSDHLVYNFIYVIGKGIAQAKNTQAEPKKKTPRRQKGKKTPVKAALGARRNLTFDDGNTRKSPRKRLLQNTPKKWDKTPKKTKSRKLIFFGKL